MGDYNGAEVCGVVGLFLLNNLGKNFEKNSVDLYRDDGFAISKNINGHHADKIFKEFHQWFTEKGLSLETESKIETVNYLDITF